MQIRKKLHVLAIAVGAICALAALGASPAMAESISTKFNANTATLSGTNLTVKKNGGEAKTCQLKATSGTASESNGTLTVYSQPVWYTLPTRLECTGGTQLHISMIATGKYDTVTGAYSLRSEYAGNFGEGYISPYGTFLGGYGQNKETIAGWTNGSGSTPSTINFNETYLGVLESDHSAKITLTGTITATTSTGGLLTLSH